MQHTFPCYRCGAHNIIGVKNCGNCYSPFYYNCPHCSAWVDNTFVNCPTCRNDLNWPATAMDGDTIYGATHIKSGYTVSRGNRSAWPAVLLSLLGAVALLVIPISLAASNSLSPKPAVNQSSTTSADSSQAIHPAQLYSPKPNSTPTPDNSQSPNILSSTNTISSSTYSTIPSPPSSSSLYIAPGSYNPGASDYLRSIYPNWGVCVGGSCSRFTQSQ